MFVDWVSNDSWVACIQLLVLVIMLAFYPKGGLFFFPARLGRGTVHTLFYLYQL